MQNLHMSKKSSNFVADLRMCEMSTRVYVRKIKVVYG